MSEKKRTVLGVIGGSGFYQIEGIKLKCQHEISTPFGKPSENIIEAEIEGRQVFFLPRHGIGHKFTPSEVNYRANIFALKTLGVTNLLSVSAVGIMQEHIKPGDMIIPDQIFDRTSGIRSSTFFGEGIVGHVSLADPFCNQMRELVHNAAKSLANGVQFNGTLVVIEGPQFSTRAESNFYRKTLNPVAIGMTTLPEAKLAREAEMCYALLAMATDYDCWHEIEEDVSVEAVIAVVKKNAKTANAIIQKIAQDLPAEISCECFEAAKCAIMTSKEAISPSARKKLSVLYEHYLK